MSRLLSTLTLLALLLLAAAPASGVMVRDEKTAVPDFFGSSLESASGDEWPATQYRTRGGVDCSYETALDVRVGPNLYAYVKQNPWTAWDPDGLASSKRSFKEKLEDGISGFLSPITTLINKSRDQDARRTVAQTTGTIQPNMQMGQADGVANSAPAMMSAALAGGALNTMASGPLVLPSLSSFNFGGNATKSVSINIETKVSDTLVKASKATTQEANAMVNSVLKARTAGAAAKSALAPAKRASGSTVLGHYPEYAKMADTLGHRRFDIPTAAWDKMTEAQRWTANHKFLDRTISRGDDILLSTPLDKVRSRSYFERELQYLSGKGYRPSADGSRLIPGGN